MNRKVIRVVTPFYDKHLTIPILLDCLNHAGVIKIHRDDQEGYCFDIFQPAMTPLGNKEWCHLNAEQMSSLGLNAVAAPE